MHENSMDVCIEVVKSWEFRPGIYTWKFYWWNLGYSGKPWRIFPTLDRIDLTLEEKSKWKHIEHKMHIPRTKSGLP